MTDSESPADQPPPRSYEQYEYSVRILIKHPTMDPARITRVLGEEPNHTCTVGTPRRTPKGTLLPGLHKESAWSMSDTFTGDRLFFADVAGVVDWIEPQKAFLHEIVEGGGEISLGFHLYGDTNIGDECPWQELARLAALHVELDVEVFPYARHRQTRTPDTIVSPQSPSDQPEADQLTDEQLRHEFHAHHGYTVNLVIKHPTMDPARITRVLAIEPSHVFLAGVARQTPQGRPLSEADQENVWSLSYPVTGNRFFLEDVGKMAGKLERHKAFLHEIVEGGGRISLGFDLSGAHNIGDTCPWQDLARLAALHISLGVQVFP